MPKRLRAEEPPSAQGLAERQAAAEGLTLERAGNSDRGSITGLFNVLVEADDMNDPIADATRSVLDGHLVLSRDLAAHNHYPAIDVLDSVSRLARDLLTNEEWELASSVREVMAVHRKNQDLINIGAYNAGSNPKIDEAIRLHEPVHLFLKQGVDESFRRQESWSLLEHVMRPQETTEEEKGAQGASCDLCER